MPGPPLLGRLAHECGFQRPRGRLRDTGQEAQGKGRLRGQRTLTRDLPLVLWLQIWSGGEPGAVAVAPRKGPSGLQWVPQ